MTNEDIQGAIFLLFVITGLLGAVIIYLKEILNELKKK